MTTITYGRDVQPHLQKAAMYRKMRFERWSALHQDHFKFYDAENPSRGTRLLSFLMLIVEFFAVAIFVIWSLTAHAFQPRELKHDKSGRTRILSG